MTTGESSMESGAGTPLGFPSAAQWRATADRLPNGLAITRGPDHVVSYANAAFRALVGEDGHPVLTRSLGELLDLDEATLALAYGAGTEERWIDCERSLPGAAPRSLRVHVSRVPEVEDAPAGLLVVVHDITDQVAIRRELVRTGENVRDVNEQLVVGSVRQHERADLAELETAHLRGLFEGLPEGVVIADASGRPVLVNAAARRILGVADGALATADEYRGLELRHLDGTLLADDEGPLSRALAGERFFEADLLYTHASGERRRLAVSATSVSDEKGEPALVVALYRDVTEVRALEESREEYLGLVAHDLRVPLTSVILSVSALQILLARRSVPEEEAHADRIARNAARLSTMIDDLLEMTRLAAGAVALSRAPLDLAAICRDVVERLDAARRVRVRIEAPPEPRLVLGDAQRIERALSNLVSNALKYSPTTEPVLVRIDGPEQEVVVEVIDRGAGVAPAEVSHLFERFFRGAAGRAAGGIGLGLYIARQVVEAHGGRISADSEVGRGSTFRIALPAMQSPSG